MTDEELEQQLTAIKKEIGTSQYTIDIASVEIKDERVFCYDSQGNVVVLMSLETYERLTGEAND